MQEFQIEQEYIELIKLLKAASLVGTGGEAKMVVREGLVTVDGQTELRLRCKIRPGQTVTFQHQSITVTD